MNEMTIAASTYDIPAFAENHGQSGTDGHLASHMDKMVLSVEGMAIGDQQKLRDHIPTPDSKARPEPVPFPLHHHAEIVHGQGTVSLQLERDTVPVSAFATHGTRPAEIPAFGAVICDFANGVTLSGVCMAFSGESTQVFGAAPSSGFWEQALGRYLHAQQSTPDPSRSRYWDDLEIPIGAVPWTTFTAPRDLTAVYDVEHEAMCAASLAVSEHCGLRVQPDQAAPLAVALYNEDFRRMASQNTRGGRRWAVGVLLQPRRATLAAQSSRRGGRIDCLAT